MKLVKERFVAVATDDVKYSQHPDKAKKEWRVLSKAMGGRTQLQQGIYVISSAGEYLGRINKGWPDPDPVAMLQDLRRALKEYTELPRERRILGERLDPATDKLRWEEDAFLKPARTLDLRIVSRGYAYPGMTSFDQRHPMYFHIDRLWFKPSEWRAWLPSRLEEGASVEVGGPARNRIVLLSHHQAGGSAWWESHVRGGKMTSTVTKVSGDSVDLTIRANYVMRADSQWCKDSYDGDLLAFATYSKAKDAFTRFDLAMLGTHTVGERRENLHAGDLTARIAAAASINAGSDPDDRMLPQQWKYGYGLAWGRAGE